MISKFAKGRAFAFIDASNILYSQQTLGWRIDYRKLKDYLDREAQLAGLFYYTGKIGSLEKQLNFIKKMERTGYKVIAREIKFIKLKKNKFLPKGNLDVELALDAYRLCDNYDTMLFI